MLKLRTFASVYTMERRWAYLLPWLLLLAGLVLSSLSSPIWYDDAGHWLVAREIARGHGMCYPLTPSGGNCMPDSPFITMGPVLAYPLGWWLKLFGEGMLTARVLMVLLSMGVGASLYALARMLTDGTKAGIAVALMAVNVQFITYGSEALGEVPMMGLGMLGLMGFLKWQRGGSLGWAALGVVSWTMAFGIKEYAIFPLGLGLVFWWLFLVVKRDRAARVFVLGLVLAVACFASSLVMHGGWFGMVEHFLGRKSYGSEFLAFGLWNSLSFLLLKPLFWLGMVAMVVRWRIQRREEDGWAIAFQGGWVVFFLLSAGYDRFGFLLLFLPAVYLGEFGPYLWREAGREKGRAFLRRTVLVLLCLVVFGQQTYWRIGQRLGSLQEVNAAEKAAVGLLASTDRSVLTVDQQVVPFLEAAGLSWRLINVVPSEARIIPPKASFISPREGEYLLAGPYAFTEYQGTIRWQDLTPRDTVEMGGQRWVVYSRANGGL